MNEETLNSETSIIGGLLMFPDECKKAIEALSADDFESEYGREVFTNIADAVKAGKRVDVAIFNSQDIDPQLKRYAMTCAERFVCTETYDEYIETVKNAAQKRRLFHGLQEIILSDGESGETIAALERLIETEKAQGALQHDAMKDRLTKYYENVYKPLDKAERIYTGFSRLDRVLNGLRKGSLSYIGAAPSTGKTSFALNIALHAIREKRRVLFFSLEMSTEQLLDRLFSNALSIDYGKIDKHELQQTDTDRLAQAIDEILKHENLTIIDDTYTLESMATKIAQIKPDIVFADFLQNVRTRERFSVRKNQIDYISAEFKRLARINDCHVMVLSQINRVGEQGAPRMTDLKESGSLECDGDLIMLLYRPYVQDKGKYKPSETHVLIDKNKFGGAGKLNFCFDGTHQRFTEMEERYG